MNLQALLIILAGVPLGLAAPVEPADVTNRLASRPDKSGARSFKDPMTTKDMCRDSLQTEHTTGNPPPPPGAVRRGTGSYRDDARPLPQREQWREQLALDPFERRKANQGQANQDAIREAWEAASEAKKGGGEPEEERPPRYRDGHERDDAYRRIRNEHAQRRMEDEVDRVRGIDPYNINLNPGHRKAAEPYRYLEPIPEIEEEEEVRPEAPINPDEPWMYRNPPSDINLRLKPPKEDMEAESEETVVEVVEVYADGPWMYRSPPADLNLRLKPPMEDMDAELVEAPLVHGYEHKPDGGDKNDYGYGGCKPEHGRPEHGRLEHGKPEHGKPEHGKPEYGRPEHGRPNHGDNHYKPDYINYPPASLEIGRASCRERV